MNLDANFDLSAFIQPYMTRIVLQQLEPKRWTKQVYGTVEDLAKMVTNLPLQLHQIPQKLQKDNLKLELDHTNLDRLIQGFNRVSNRISFSLIIATLIVGSSIILQDVSSWGYKSILGVMGYLTAGIFGVGLVISILRSGRF